MKRLVPMAPAPHQVHDVRVDRDLVVTLLREMVGVPSPNGAERALAHRLAAVGPQLTTGLVWNVDEFDDASANLLVTMGETDVAAIDVLLLAHLDTSLDGPHEAARLGASISADIEPTGLRIEDGCVIGHGVAVAKGPAAGALAALDAVHDRIGPGAVAGVLLTGGGTHRSRGRAQLAAGLVRALAQGLSPRAAVNVKAGAPTVLHEEPASAYLRLEVTAPGGPALLRGDSDASGAASVLAHIGPPVESWRRRLRARELPGTSGYEVGLGSIDVGLVDKPDLLPTRGVAHLYLVHPPGESPADLIGGLGDELRAHGLGDRVSVSVLAELPAGRTDPDHDVVQLARAAWRRHLGDPGRVHAWCGSTDAALLRAHGVPVARLGPRPRSATAGLEALDLDELMTFARIDAELLLDLSDWVRGPVGPSGPTKEET